GADLRQIARVPYREALHGHAPRRLGVRSLDLVQELEQVAVDPLGTPVERVPAAELPHALEERPPLRNAVLEKVPAGRESRRDEPPFPPALELDGGGLPGLVPLLDRLGMLAPGGGHLHVEP